jgi:TldD protein
MACGITRRAFIQRSATGAAAVAAASVLDGCAKKLTGRSLTPMNEGYFELFGVDRELVRKVLEKATARGGDFADLFFQHRISSSVGLEDGSVNRASSSVDLGAGVRVVVGDQIGYAFTEDLSPEALMDAARTASAIASGGKVPLSSAFRVVPHGSFYRQKTGWDTIGVSRIKPLLEVMNKTAMAFDPRIKKVQCMFACETGRILVADSNGGWAEDEQPMGTTFVSCVAEQNGRREDNMAHVSKRTGFEGFDEEVFTGLAKKAAERTILMFDAVKPPPGDMPVVLAAGSSGILLHEAIGHGMEADFNRKKISIYCEMLGKKIAEPFISIVDDGTVEGERGAINIDDEGTAGQRTVLVDKGILTSYMHDKISAGHYKVAPTGNGRRQSFRHQPIPRMRCTYMLPGPHKKDEIIASVKKGIYAVTFTNGQVQIGAGDFTFYIKSGYLIEDGKLTAPIKDVNIIGNGPAVLANVQMAADDTTLDHGRWTCGKDGQSVPVSLGLPTVKVKSITVGGSK